MATWPGINNAKLIVVNDTKVEYREKIYQEYYDNYLKNHPLNGRVDMGGQLSSIMQSVVPTARY